MKTMYLAPLGMQPGAVVAPLLSLGLARGDEVVLLTTEPIVRAGIVARSERLLLKKLSGVGVRKENLGGVPADAKRFDRVTLLINGGEAGAVHRLADALLTLKRPTQVEFAESRGIHGTVFDRGAKTIRDFAVADVGLDDLLELLNLDYSQREDLLSSRNNADEKLTVEKVLERAGCLFAGIMIDPRNPGVDSFEVDRERLAAYRAMLRWQSLQHELGLESRRMLLVHRDEPAFPRDTWPARLAARAARDGIPAIGRRMGNKVLDRAAWRKMVESGEAMDLPEILAASEPRHLKTPGPWVGSGKWQGPALYVIAGTQPGASLRTIWAHQPGRLVWIYDSRSPRVLDTLSRLRVLEKYFGVSTVEFVPVTGLGEMAPIEGAHVALTPGDKASKFRLMLWAKRFGPIEAPKNDGIMHSLVTKLFGRQENVSSATSVRLTPCYLNGNTVSCGESAGHVPLRTWISAHTVLYVEDAREIKRPSSEQAADTVRNAALAVKLAIDSGEKIKKEDLFLPPSSALPAVEAACGAVRGGGFWMEDLSGNLLAVFCDEVLVGTKLKREPRHERFEDEFDVITAMRGHYALWSCKTAVSPLKLARAAREARGQATRFLGRMELAVVVCPRIRVSRKNDRAGGGWWQYDELTWIVDLGFLADAKRAATLAGTRPSGPRGAGRWNPFSS